MIGTIRADTSMTEAQLSIYYSPHQVQYMPGRFEDLLRQNDILIIEAASQKVEVYEKDFNALCRGKFSPKAMRAKYQAKPEMIVLYELLHKTGKRVVFEKSPIRQSDVEQLVALDNTAISYATHRDVRQALALKRKALLTFAEFNNRRDAELANLVSTLVTANAVSRVLAWRGIAHRRKFDAELSSRRIPHMSFAAPDCPLGPLSSLAERLANGESITDEEIVPVLTEMIGES